MCRTCEAPADKLATYQPRSRSFAAPPPTHSFTSLTLICHHTATALVIVVLAGDEAGQCTERIRKARGANMYTRLDDTKDINYIDHMCLFLFFNVFFVRN